MTRRTVRLGPTLEHIGDDCEARLCEFALRMLAFRQGEGGRPTTLGVEVVAGAIRAFCEGEGFLPYLLVHRRRPGWPGWVITMSGDANNLLLGSLGDILPLKDVYWTLRGAWLAACDVQSLFTDILDLRLYRET